MDAPSQALAEDPQAFHNAALDNPSFQVRAGTGPRGQASVAQPAYGTDSDTDSDGEIVQALQTKHRLTLFIHV